MTVTWASDLNLDTTPIAFAVALDAGDANSEVMLQKDHAAHSNGAELMRQKKAVKYVMFQGDKVSPGDRFVLLKVKTDAPFTGTLVGAATGSRSAPTLRTASTGPSSPRSGAGAAAGSNGAQGGQGGQRTADEAAAGGAGIGAACGVCEKSPCRFNVVKDHIVGISHSGSKTPLACRRAVWAEFKINTPSPKRGKKKDIKGHVKIPRCVVEKTNVLFRD